MADKQSRLAEIYKAEKERGGGVLSTLGKRAKEKFDPRQMFNQKGFAAAALPSLFKSYDAVDKTKKIKELSESGKGGFSSAVLESGIGTLITETREAKIHSKIAAKNSSVLPAMAMDMNLTKLNIMKLVKLQGGTATKNADMFFKRAGDREAAYESKFSKAGGVASTKPTQVGAKPEEKESGGILSFLGTIASYLLKGGLLGLLAIGVSKLLENQDVVDGIKSFVKQVILGIQTIIQKGSGILGDLFSDPDVKEGFIITFVAIKDLFVKGINLLGDLASDPRFAEGVVQIFSAIWQAIKKAFVTLDTYLKDQLNVPGGLWTVLAATAGVVVTFNGVLAGLTAAISRATATIAGAGGNPGVPGTNGPGSNRSKLGKAAGIVGLTAMGAGFIMSLFPGKKVEDLTPEEIETLNKKAKEDFTKKNGRAPTEEELQQATTTAKTESVTASNNTRDNISTGLQVAGAASSAYSVYDAVKTPTTPTPATTSPTPSKTPTASTLTRDSTGNLLDKNGKKLKGAALQAAEEKIAKHAAAVAAEKAGSKAVLSIVGKFFSGALRVATGPIGAAWEAAYTAYGIIDYLAPDAQQQVLDNIGILASTQDDIDSISKDTTITDKGRKIALDHQNKIADLAKLKLEKLGVNSVDVQEKLQSVKNPESELPPSLAGLGTINPAAASVIPNTTPTVEGAGGAAFGMYSKPGMKPNSAPNQSNAETSRLAASGKPTPAVPTSTPPASPKTPTASSQTPANAEPLKVKKLSKEQSAMATLIYNKFTAAGFTEEQATAAVVNSFAESSLNPKSESRKTDKEASYGLFQMNTKGGLGEGHDPEKLKDPNYNIDLMIQAAKGKAGEKFRSATTVEAAITAFTKDLERPKNADAEAAKRVALASAITNYTPTAATAVASNSPEKTKESPEEPKLSPMEQVFNSMLASSGIDITKISPDVKDSAGKINQATTQVAEAKDSKPQSPIVNNVTNNINNSKSSGGGSSASTASVYDDLFAKLVERALA